jgi:hypothetical protein
MSISMTSFLDELMKISSAEGAVSKALPFLKGNAKSLALLGGGAATYHFGKKELDKYMLGRQVYDQMQTRGQ